MISIDGIVENTHNVSVKRSEAEASEMYAELQTALENQSSVILNFKLPGGREQTVSRHVTRKEEVDGNFVFFLEV